MKITVRWQDDEEGLVVCKEKRREICRIRMYVMEESAAELSLELPEEDKEIDEKIISEMTNCFSELQAVLEEEGLPESTIVAEEGSLSAKLLNAMCSTGVVNKEYSEYLLKKQSEAADSKKTETKKMLSILQLKNEDSVNIIYCTRSDEKDLFSCKLMPYREGYYIYEVLVREEMRGKGIGTAAMRELLARADELPGAKPPVIFYLQVSSLNERAWHLYRKLGFETEVEFCYYRFGGET